MQFIKKLVTWNKCIVFVLLFAFFNINTIYSAPDNFEFRAWCVQTFDGGSDIYEAYKTINFDIEYVYDSNGDFWQKPKETLKLKQGDCEDSMFLFSSLISLDLENVEIVWGYVSSEYGMFKHVYGRLTDKNGKIYLLQNYYKRTWGGIILEEKAKQTMIWTPIVILTQPTFVKITKDFKKIKTFDTEIFYKIVQSLPKLQITNDNIHEIYNVFYLLHGVYSR